jgi:pimeloyl-ACP methyl ester carboxylesterase
MAQSYFADLSTQSSIGQMAESVLSQCPEGPFVAVGFSMGAIVALELARVAPDRLLPAWCSSPSTPPPTCQNEAPFGRVSSGGWRTAACPSCTDELKPNYLALGQSPENSDMLRLTMQMASIWGPKCLVRQSEATSSPTAR